MSEDEQGRTFLSRWSRRKIAARQAESAAEPPAASPIAAPGAVAAEAVADETHAEAGGANAATATQPLPDVETLQGVESEYREFLRPGVDESLRRTALKKLFADPHFNVMDGLDVYIDDYSKPDPIPSAMLRSLNQARGLRLFDDEEEAQTAASLADGAPPQPTPASESVEAAVADETGDVGPTESRTATEETVVPSESAVRDPTSGQFGSV